MSKSRTCVLSGLRACTEVNRSDWLQCYVSLTQLEREIAWLLAPPKLVVISVTR